MNIRTLLLALVLLVFSSFAIADEMGTGASSTSTSDQQNMAAPEPGTEPSGDDTEDAFWRMLLDWFE